MQTPTTPSTARRTTSSRAPRLGTHRRMRRVRRSFAATALLLLALSLLPWGGSPAHAHASLIASEPRAGANLPDAPETLFLTFNEDITLLETTRLIGPGGETPYRFDVNGGLVELRPETELEDGRWDLVWQIVSADGHLVGGVIPFTIGDDASAYNTSLAEGLSASAAPDTPGAQDRILELLGWLAAIGALGAILAGRGPLGWGLAAGAIAFPLRRIVGVGQYGTTFFDRWGEIAWAVGETRAAAAAAAAGALFFVAALLTGRSRSGAAALGVLGVLTWSTQALLSGHPNVIDPRPLYAALSALHLAGALTWSAAVAAVLMNPEKARHASRIATIGITLLIPGALLLVTAFVPAALASGAGRWEGILAVKAAIVIAALAIGLRNHRACRCDTCRRNGCACPLTDETRRGLRRRTIVETGLIAIVAVLSALLTTSIPARLDAPDTGATSLVTVPDTDETGSASGTDGGMADENEAHGNETGSNEGNTRETTPVNAELLFENGETGELLLEINEDGNTTIHLVLRDPDGNPFTAEQVEYELENPGLGIVGISGQLPVSGAMHMGETVLPGDGTWRISVNATYETFTTIGATTEFETPGTTP